MSSDSNELLEVIRKSKEEERLEMERYIEIVEEILKYFECKKCGNCCKDKDIQLVEGDLKRLHIPPRNVGSFVKDRETLEVVTYLEHPCEYLTKDNLCKVNEFKPTVCRIYPFRLDKALYLCPLGKEIHEEIKRAREAEVETFADFLEYLKIIKNMKIDY